MIHNFLHLFFLPAADIQISPTAPSGL